MLDCIIGEPSKESNTNIFLKALIKTGLMQEIREQQHIPILDPGEYIFRVKASNRDGVWNETGASIKIIINPPLWATTWAYLFYALVIISLLYFTWKLQLKANQS
ncbi:MAG: hypothetical protein MZV64_31320 [Ignavibacteriales bacterium]|nr:hypothetical protein [Ignavibacteriales bacterium]